MNNVRTNVPDSNTYKLSEVFLSFLLVISAGLSFSVTHTSSRVLDDGTTNLPRMRGPERQHIQMGVPEAWINNVTNELKAKGINVSISKLKDAWFVDAVFSNSLSDSEYRELVIFLERHGVNAATIKEFHITLTGY